MISVKCHLASLINILYWTLMVTDLSEVGAQLYIAQSALIDFETRLQAAATACVSQGV